MVLGATEEGVGVLYPRKGGEGSLEEVVLGGGGGGGDGSCGGAGGGGRGGTTSGGVSTERVDLGLLHDYVKLGVAELVNRAVERVERRVAQSEGNSAMAMGASSTTTITASVNGGGVDNDIGGGSAVQPPKKGAAIASALSLALCTINRFMVASHAGVSALANNASLSSRYKDDEGVLALIGGGGGSGSNTDASSKQSHTRGSNALSPRALIIQASPDRTSDYNALMNCAFASIKSEIVIDGCFIPSGMKDDETSSPYLQQLVDQTGGVYLSVPSGAAQIGGALSEVLLSVFLPPPQIRNGMNLPKLHNVDFRARCFESGESVDVAQICNQCLSIFKERPKEVCLTCGARVRSSRKSSSSSSRGMKKMKLK